MKLRLEEIEFDAASMIDNAGRLFRWNGCIYRAINRERTQFFVDLFEKKHIQELFNKGLVEATIAPLSVEGYGLVLEHRVIPFVSYCVEWTATMLKDAALLICDFALELHNKGLTLKDAHPWNILFDKGFPIFVDWGSIENLENQPGWPYSQFRDRFVFPLYLMSAGRSFLVRDLMLDVLNTPSRGDFLKLLFGRLSITLWLNCWRMDRFLTQRSANPDHAYFRALRNFVERIPTDSDLTEWSNYEGPEETLTQNPSDNWPLKMRNVHLLLQKLMPRTVMDIGCNQGWFSEMASREGASVIAVDLDEPSVSKLYQRIKTSGADIFPVFMDVCVPTPKHGVAGGYLEARERLQVDLVLALAVTHHLVFKRSLTFEAIANQLSMFTTKWLIVEFVPPDDKYVREWMSERFSWYHLDGFKRALKKFFSQIEVMDSSPSPRVLLWCEK